MATSLKVHTVKQVFDAGLTLQGWNRREEKVLFLLDSSLTTKPYVILEGDSEISFEDLSLATAYFNSRCLTDDELIRLGG